MSENPREQREESQEFDWLAEGWKQVRYLCKRTVDSLRERLIGTDVDPFVPGEEVYVLLGNGEIEKWIVYESTEGLVVQTPNREIIRGELRYRGTKLNPSKVAHKDEIERGANRRRTALRQEFVAEQRRRVALEKHATLSKVDFDNYFSGELKQQNVGNCFLIAALNSIRRSRQGEAIIRTSVRRGKPPALFEIGFPLGNLMKTKWIPITKDDLKPEPYHRDGMTHLHPVTAKDGWQAMEAAYIKLISKSDVVRRTTVNQGGNSRFALSDMFDFNVEMTAEGTGQDVMSAQGGLIVKNVTDWLNHFSNTQDIATVGSRNPKTDSELRRKTYEAQGLGGIIPIVFNHAYSIRSVDRANQVVVVENPHDTSKQLRFTYEQFLAAFACINGVKINPYRIFKPDKQSQEKPTRRYVGPPPPPPRGRGGMNQDKPADGYHHETTRVSKVRRERAAA
jgi:hypothetical protein